jgi:hypothetical protein
MRKIYLEEARPPGGGLIAYFYALLCAALVVWVPGCGADTNDGTSARELERGLWEVLDGVGPGAASDELAALAQRLEEDCAALRHLDEAAYRSECVDSGVVALAGAVVATGGGAAAARPGDVAVIGAGKQPPQVVDEGVEGVEALRADLKATAARLEYAYLSHERRALIDVEASLMSYRDILRAAAPEGAAVPDEPFVLLERDQRQKVHDLIAGKMRGLRAQRSTPGLHAEVAILSHYLDRIEPLIAADAPATFHLARDALDEHKRAAGLARLQDEKARNKAMLTRVHEEAHGPLWTDPGPPGPDEAGTPRSRRVRNALCPKSQKPVERLRAGALLQAEFAELRANGALADDVEFEPWMRSQLSRRDRVITVVDLARVAGQSDGDEELRAALSRGSASSVGPSLRAFDGRTVKDVPETCATYFALAHAEYPHLTGMPPLLSDELSAIVDAEIHSSFGEVERLFGRVDQIQRTLAAATEPLDAAASDELAKLRAQAVELARRTEARMLALEAAGYVVDTDLRRRVIVWRHLAGDTDPPPRPAALALFDGKSIELRHAVETRVNALATIAEGSSAAPPSYTRAPGRRVATAEHFKGDVDRFRAIVPNPDQPRLPEGFADYEGRRDPSGRHYDFDTKVRDFTTFNPVGGGIHMGTVAAVDAALDGALLRYDVSRKQLVLVLPGGESRSLAAIDPVSLKALYRYVRYGANLAVSIGDSPQSGPSLERGSQVVLLDPLFVDTPIGQTLVLVDKLPWDLGEANLPNGSANPIAGEFAALLAAEKESRHIAALRGWLKSAPALDSAAWSVDAPDLNGVRVIDGLFELILAKRSGEAALKEVGQLTDGDNKRLALLLDGAKDWKTAAARVASMNITYGRLLRRQTQFLYAMFKEDTAGLSADSAATLFVGMSPSKTLATLIDDEVTLRAQPEPSLRAKLRWYYATSEWRVTDNELTVERTRDDELAARHMEPLERLVTDNIAALAERYSPLAKLHTYAAICALLRRAERVGGGPRIYLDLSTLSTVRGSDPKQSPTPDAVTL